MTNPELPNTKTISLDVDYSTDRDSALIAAAQNISQSDLVRNLLINYLEEQKVELGQEEYNRQIAIGLENIRQRYNAAEMEI